MPTVAAAHSAVASRRTITAALSTAKILSFRRHVIRLPLETSTSLVFPRIALPYLEMLARGNFAAGSLDPASVRAKRMSRVAETVAAGDHENAQRGVELPR